MYDEFEYTTITMSESGIYEIETLNELSKEGWELTSVVNNNGVNTYYFKRRL